MKTIIEVDFSHERESATNKKIDPNHDKGAKSKRINYYTHNNTDETIIARNEEFSIDRNRDKNNKEFKLSGIHSDIVELNFQIDINPYNVLLPDNVKRRNTGRIADGELKRYKNIDLYGGWWCTGIDPFTFEKMEWGCYKPNLPRRLWDDKIIKYEHPVKTPTRAFFLDVSPRQWEQISIASGIPLTEEDREGCFWKWVITKDVPVILCEGAKKAACLLSNGFVAVGLPGINSAYRTPKNEEKEKTGATVLIPEIEILNTKGRDITICFDHDVKVTTVANVQRAISQIGFLLRKATVYIASWKVDEKGVDDLIVNRGVDAFREVMKMTKTFTIFSADSYSKFTYSPDIELNQRYIGKVEIPEDVKFVVVKAPKGTGKTEMLIDLVKKASADSKPVIILTHRRQLGRAICQRTGMTYKDDMRRGDSTEYLGFGLCLDSMHPLSGANFEADNWKNAVVIIDECEQVFWHLLDGKTEIKQHRVEVIKQMKKLLTHALVSPRGQLILLDADVSDLSIDYVHSLTGSNVKPFILQNEWKGTTNNVIDYSDSKRDVWFYALLKQIEAGEKVYVCTQSQKTNSRFSTTIMEEFLKTKFLNKKILRVDSETLSDNTHPAFGFLEDANKMVGEYDIVLTSPAVETGVSIDVRSHFSSVFGVFSGVTSANTVRQSLARVRESVPRHIWVAKEGLGKIGNGSSSVCKLRTSAMQMFKLNLGQLRTAGETIEEDELELNTASLNCWLKMAVRINYDMWNYREAVIGGLKEEGHNIISNEDTTPTEGLIDEIDGVKEIVYQNERIEIAGADISGIDEVAQAKSKKKKIKTREERNKERKYDVLTRYGKQVTPDLLLLDDQGWFNQLRLHYYATIGELFLAERDRNLAKKPLQVKSIFIPDFNKSQIKSQVETFNLLGITEFLSKPDQELSNQSDEIGKINQMAIRNKDEIKTILNVQISEKQSATKNFSQLIAKWGLSLKMTSRQRVDGKQIRSYRIVGLDDGREEVFTNWEATDIENLERKAERELKEAQERFSHPPEIHDYLPEEPEETDWEVARLQLVEDTKEYDRVMFPFKEQNAAIYKRSQLRRAG